MMRLGCRVCGKPLTHPGEWGTLSQRDESVGDRQSPCPAGLLIRMKEKSGPVYDGSGQQIGTHLFSPEGAIAVHPDTVIDGALVSCGRDNGCCGSDGSDGPNRACTCGNVVATEWSDCWTWAEVRFLPDAVVEVAVGTSAPSP